MVRPLNYSVNETRRAVLRRIGLVAGMVYAAPAFMGLDVARASGGSGRGGSGPSGPSGPSRPSSRRSTDRQRNPQPSVSRPVRRQARPVPPPPELIALVPTGVSLEPAVLAGFDLLSERENRALSARVARFGLPQGSTSAQAIAQLNSLLPGVVADENHLYTPDEFLCDGAECSAHEMIGWSGWQSSIRPRLGMIDTGVNLSHPSLSDRRLTVHQIDLGDRQIAGRQHGTAIAAMLVGNVEGRVPGLLPDAELIAVGAFHRRSGTEQADAFSVTEAIDVMIGEGVDVVNLSFSGPANTVLERMIARAAEAGIGLVAAAGNGGPGAAPAYPAAWPQVVAVTAVDARGRIYRQANQGPYIALAAPGVNIWTAASISGGRLRSGTSYAVPFVTAVMAAARFRQPELNLDDVTEQLFTCARDLGEAGFDPVFGHGLISAPGQCGGDSQFFSVSGE